jgi:hypothetical protein
MIRHKIYRVSRVNLETVFRYEMASYTRRATN